MITLRMLPLMRRNPVFHFSGLGGVWVYGTLGLVCLQLSACSWRAPVQPISTAKPVQGGVTLSNVVLTQTDAKGQLLWKFQAQGVSYGDRQQFAKAKSLKGQLYEAGRPVFDITAQGGTVQQTRQQVRLQGNIQVTDRQRRAIFRGREVEWKPEAGLLQVQNGLTVVHPQIQLWANGLQASKQGREVRVQGNVRMETRSQKGKDQPHVRLKANQAWWNIDQQRVRMGVVETTEQQPTVEMERIDPKLEKALAWAGEAQADLKSGVVVLRSPVRLQLGTPAVTLTSRELTWDTQAQRLFTRDLLEIQDPRHQVAVLANQGSLDQTRSLVDLRGKVEVTSLRDRSRLTADQLLWQTQTQKIEAQRNVNYVQLSPALNIRAPKAVGKIEGQTIRMSGGNVVTEINPQSTLE